MGALRERDRSRLVEVDDYLYVPNQLLALASLLTGVAFIPLFGGAFAALLSLPALWWAARAVGIERRIGLRPWIVSLLAIVSVTIAGASSASGGSGSAILFFAGIVGIGSQVYFPGFRLTMLVGLGIVVVVASIDLVIGRDLHAFEFVTAAILGAYLPFILQRLTEMERLHRRSAVIDPLTGCLNRRSLETRIAELEVHAERTGDTISIVSFDLDHFKAVNDQHGHAAGDRILEHVAYVVRKQLRRFELFYRLGGEEFAILLPATDLAEAIALAERLRTAVAASPIAGIEVTASFGVSAADPPLSVNDILTCADEHLYDAKRAGRNRVAGGAKTRA